VNNLSEDKEKSPYIKKSTEGMIFKGIMVGLVILVIAGALTTQIKIERQMMIGDIEVLDIDQFFDNLYPVGVAFILIKPHYLDIDQNDPIYIAERTINNDNCWSCNATKPVKIIYETTYSFEIMNKIGIIENAEIGGTQYSPVEKALLLTLDQGEHEFIFDRQIVQELSRWKIVPSDT